MSNLIIDANPLSDYLFYALKRANHLKLPVDSHVDISNIPDVSRYGCTLPALIAYLGIRDFGQPVWDLVEEYRVPSESNYFLSHFSRIIDYEKLMLVLRAVEPQWNQFLHFWHDIVEPITMRVQKAWYDEDLRYSVLRTLEQITNLSWPDGRCRVFVSVFHPAASAPRGTGCIFGCLAGFDFQLRHSLSRFMGHEGLHVLMEGRYRGHPNFDKVIAGSEKVGCDKHMILGWTEEVLAIAMQHRLPVECGLCDEQKLREGTIDSTLDGNISYAYKTGGKQEARYVENLYWQIQNRWNKYQASKKYGSIIDFLFDCVKKVIQQSIK